MTRRPVTHVTFANLTRNGYLHNRTKQSLGYMHWPFNFTMLVSLFSTSSSKDKSWKFRQRVKLHSAGSSGPMEDDLGAFVRVVGLEVRNQPCHLVEDC
jgi:hypothetical protein